MDIAYKGEMYTPSRCGRMDQCVAMGVGSIGLMEFNGHYSSLELLACKCDVYFVVADLKKGKDTVTILKELSGCFPVPKNETEVSGYISVLYIMCKSTRNNITYICVLLCLYNNTHIYTQSNLYMCTYIYSCTCF